MEDHSNIYETMIKIITWKNIPLNKWLTMLWQSRSLSHALCASPVNDAFIMTLSNHCNLSKSMEFWISCMKGSKSLEVGFQQSLSLISTLSSPDSCKRNHAIQPHITTDEVKQAASDLINNVCSLDILYIMISVITYRIIYTYADVLSIITSCFRFLCPPTHCSLLHISIMIWVKE